MNKLIIISILGLCFLFSCSNKEQIAEVKKGFELSDTMLNMIQLDTVRESNRDDEVSLSGQVNFNENSVVKIYPRNSGQVTTCKISLGDRVVTGQTLATVKSADIAGSYSDLASANADLAIAKRQMESTESLYKNGISSEKEYTEAKLNYEKALAGRNKVQSLISINGGEKTQTGGEYILSSPIDGYVVEKKVNAGSYIRADMGDYLFTISNLRTVWVNANVYEVDIPRVKQGFPVKVVTLSYPDKIFEGKVDNISEVLDPQSKSLRARISIDNKDMLLKPDMFAKVIVTNKGGDLDLCVPTSSLVSQDGKNYVVVFFSRNEMKISEVTIIKTVGEKTYVSAGVEKGQRIVTKNQLLLFNQLTSIAP